MSDPNIGRVLAGKYDLVRLLGAGGMGAVYEGKNQIGKRVAVKLLRNSELVQDEKVTARFFREAQASAAVVSKHVVDVYDTGVDADTGAPFIIMAFLSGEDLEHVVERVGALNPVAAVRIVSQAAAGLAKAHEVGIVHRDIKPANLFLAEEESDITVKILDFGIAKLNATPLTDSDPKGLTTTGAMLGTPLYMSPEQVQGLKTVDARTDVWSLGMCLYQALAGRPPFVDVDTIGQLIVAIVAKDVPSLTSLAPWVRPELAAVVHKALERDVDKRFASARELIAALTPFASDSLALAPSLLVGVKGSLDATLAPEVPPPTPATFPSTTAGFSSARPLSVAGLPRSPRKGVVVSLAALLAIATVGLGARMLKGNDGAPVVAASSATQSPPLPTVSAPPVPAALASATVAAASNDKEKVGVVTLKLPPGFTVKVEPEGERGSSRLLDSGKLELRGHSLQKFVVAVFDEKGALANAVDLRLLDNRVEPDTVDLLHKKAPVDAPKKPAAATPPVPTGTKPADPALPGRF